MKRNFKSVLTYIISAATAVSLVVSPAYVQAAQTEDTNSLYFSAKDDVDLSDRGYSDDSNSDYDSNGDVYFDGSETGDYGSGDFEVSDDEDDWAGGEEDNESGGEEDNETGDEENNETGDEENNETGDEENNETDDDDNNGIDDADADDPDGSNTGEDPEEAPEGTDTTGGESSDTTEENDKKPDDKAEDPEEENAAIKDDDDTSTDGTEASEDADEDGTQDKKPEEEKILAPRSRLLTTDNTVVKGIKSKYYTGGQILQDVMLFYVNSQNEQTQLLEGTDFTVSYLNNVNAGTATVIINGVGVYFGSLEYRFSVKPVKIKSLELQYDSLVYNSKRRTQTNSMTVRAVVDGAEINLKAGRDFSVSYLNNINVGTAAVYVTGKGNYKGTIKGSFEIAPASISSVQLKYAKMPYSGSKRTQTESVVVRSGSGSDSRILTLGKDYVVSYKNNKQIGTARLVVKGIGNYTGTVKKSFQIVPKGTSVSKLTSGNQRIKAVWKKNANVNGYQLQYSMKSNFASRKTITISNVSTLERTIKGLKPGRTYYFRIRTYLEQNGRKYYSNWSKAAKKRIKSNIISIAGSGGKRTVKVINVNPSCTDMRMAVWTMEGGQDDLKWVDLSFISSCTWGVELSLMDMKHSGTCVAHFYSGDSFLGAETFELSNNDDFLGAYLKGSDSKIDFVQCAISIANDDSIGYGHTWPNTISCSGLVGLTLTYCGYADFIKNDPLGWGYIGYGQTFENTLINDMGCSKISGTFNSSNYKLLKAGDILRVDNEFGCHVGIYVGNGYTVEARGPEGWTSADENGYEVAVYDWRTDVVQYDTVYRIPKSNIHYRW